jgi:hypothetical protein
LAWVKIGGRDTDLDARFGTIEVRAGGVSSSAPWKGTDLQRVQIPPG